MPQSLQLPLSSFQLGPTVDLDLDSLESSLDSDCDDSSDSSSEDWSDLLGSDWRGSELGSSSESSEESLFTSDSDSGDAHDEMPELLPLGFPDSDDEDDNTSNSGSDPTSSETSSDTDEGDLGKWDWESMGGDGVDFEPCRSNNPLHWVWQCLEEMHAQQYEMPRDTFPQGPAFMRHVLPEMKDT
ncbi:hypothetical protein B0H10DRAFT_2220757 [Mycena sp. CBHHK59/15]|nr:hypothetical protein B0H10DRAFT_2220757 [Mycena sp. CBHHK59/15]